MALSTAITQDQPPADGSGDPQAEKMRDRFNAVVQKLERLAEDQVKKKKPIEARMYEDLRAYYGRYDNDTEESLRKAQKSRVFMGLTRAKTGAWEARLSDMLFPTDDRNWGIKPTPEPDLAEFARKHPGANERDIDAKGEAAAEQANQMRAAGQIEEANRLAQEAGQLTEEAKKAAGARRKIEKARERAEAMEREIDDQLTEARYASKARDALHDACKLGPGIIKGPLTASKTRRGWAAQYDGSTVHVLQQHDDPRPDWRHVSPWAYFPDMDARTKEEVEFEFERHLMNKKQLRKLAKIRGFDKGAIREVLDEGKPEPLPDYIAQLRDLTGQGENNLEGRYQVWEYHGPLDAEDIRTICECTGDADTLADLPEDDPLAEMHVIVWFCQGRLLKFGLHPMESGESLYSVFNFERDDSSVFGFGVPHLMRHSQRALNAAWRAMLDNAAMAAEPQVVVAKEMVEPQDGNWERKPGKYWWANMDRVGQGGARPFETFDIPSNQQYYANIIELSLRFASLETQMPVELEHGQSAKMADGVGGMAMLMNSVNVVFRRVVRNFDDDFTVPNIRRAYDWNMQYSERDEIKGDFEVDARGSSVLLVRELQAQNLGVIAMNASTHPVLGPMTKTAAAYRKWVQTMMVPADEVVKDDEQIAQEQKQQAEQTPPEVQEEQAKRQNLELEWQYRLQEQQIKAQTDLQTAQIERETKLMTLAEQMNMERDKLEAMLAESAQKVQAELAKTREKHDSSERIFAAEAAVEARKDAQAAARGQQDPGSGGYIS
jgi:hypothetical protein